MADAGVARKPLTRCVSGVTPADTSPIAARGLPVIELYRCCRALKRYEWTSAVTSLFAELQHADPPLKRDDRDYE